MTIEWDNQGLSENFTDIELGEQVDTTPLRKAIEERREHLWLAVMGKVGEMHKEQVKRDILEIIELAK